MSIFLRDQLNNIIQLSLPPQRIVSIVPSQTELLYELGLNEEVIGITKFCIHPPEWFQTKQRIGGTKNVNIDRVKALHPDLIIANKEENVKEQIEELQKVAPVWVSDIYTLDDALEMITTIGKLVNKQQRANDISTQVKNSFNQLIPLSRPISSAYLIWKDPYMAAGGNTFINDMLDRCGFDNIFKRLSRYPEIDIPHMLTSNNTGSAALVPPLFLKHCEILLLSSEPYPFRPKHIDELNLQQVASKIVLVDGEMFSWYGSRLLRAPAYFQKLIQEIQG
ncbi:MAG: transporter substrate-binding protein [Segetibacter sp.]|jgi:ABC-type Fe3+-hydroxamate transport system substrate-binding protein|nr:transporter substrate-binding protein [Segetibacter sp.]